MISFTTFSMESKCLNYVFQYYIGTHINMTNKKKNQHGDRLVFMTLYNMPCMTDLRSNPPTMHRK